MVEGERVPWDWVDPVINLSLSHLLSITLIVWMMRQLVMRCLYSCQLTYPL